MLWWPIVVGALTSLLAACAIGLQGLPLLLAGHGWRRPAGLAIVAGALLASMEVWGWVLFGRLWY